MAPLEQVPARVGFGIVRVRHRVVHRQPVVEQGVMWRVDECAVVRVANSYQPTRSDDPLHLDEGIDRAAQVLEDLVSVGHVV